nr:uncharacterized protein LOC127321540 [Lolium perenne]
MEARGLKVNVKVMGSMEEIVKEKGTRREADLAARDGQTSPPISTGTAALPLHLRMTALSPYLRRHYRPTVNAAKLDPLAPHLAAPATASAPIIRSPHAPHAQQGPHRLPPPIARLLPALCLRPAEHAATHRPPPSHLTPAAPPPRAHSPSSTRPHQQGRPPLLHPCAARRKAHPPPRHQHARSAPIPLRSTAPIWFRTRRPQAQQRLHYVAKPHSRASANPLLSLLLTRAPAAPSPLSLETGANRAAHRATRLKPEPGPVPTGTFQGLCPIFVQF